jgi:Ras-related protein Rab-18
MTSSRAVKYEEGQALADKHNSSFCEVSSKTRENVRKPFIEVVDQIVQSPNLMSTTARRSGGIEMSDRAASSLCSC